MTPTKVEGRSLGIFYTYPSGQLRILTLVPQVKDAFSRFQRVEVIVASDADSFARWDEKLSHGNPRKELVTPDTVLKTLEWKLNVFAKHRAELRKSAAAAARQRVILNTRLFNATLASSVMNLLGRAAPVFQIMLIYRAKNAAHSCANAAPTCPTS
jgi:hypothetical protein